MKFKGVKVHKWTKVILTVAIIGVAGYGIYYYKFKGSAVTATYAVVTKVEKGTVSSGIVASGQIVAANKLDLNVYKQAQRIEAVNVQNGGHVESGDTILSFDKSDSYVSVESSKVAVTSSELSLQNEKANYTDPNTTINTRLNEISDLKTAIEQADQDKQIAYRTFLNASLKADSGNNETKGRVAPTLLGLYSGAKSGTYRIQIYRSSAASGYSYHVTGLETKTESILNNVATKVGDSGLMIKFTSDIKDGDEWVIKLPNTTAPEYIQNKENYDKNIIKLDQDIAGYRLDIANKELEIKNLGQTDSTNNRNLDIAKAQADLSKARVELSQNYSVMKEQDIVAPFSGTIEGLENVVVGATPTNDNNDPIALGTLISDDFLVSFTLGAVDITKVVVGQKVLVSVTSFPSLEPLTASITEISSLPDSSGVSQYGVKALITLPASSSVKLREGLVADVEIVEQERGDVIRIPLSAVTYENGKTKVQVLTDLTAADKNSVETQGVLRSLSGTFPSYPKDITLGVTGTFYAEVTSGLAIGDLIIVSKTEKTESTVVKQQGFGPGRPQNNTGQNITTSETKAGS